MTNEGLALLTVLLFSCACVHAQDEISIKAYPPLPPEDLIRNGGFEQTFMHQYSPTRIDRLRDWSQWPFSMTSPNPWGSRFPYPDDAAEQDVEGARFGKGCLRLNNVESGLPRVVAQIVEGKDYTYTVPVAPGIGMGAEQDQDSGDTNWETELLGEETSPTHVLSFWARTDGVVPGRVQLLNITTVPRTEPILARTFENTSWKQFQVPFAAPENGSALLLVLGLAKNMPAHAHVWYDNVSILPVKTTLRYEVNMPGMKEVSIRNKTNETALFTSNERSGAVDVPLDGVYVIEVTDKAGNTVSKEYPGKDEAGTGNIIANGDFEEDPGAPVHWSEYRGASSKFGPLPAPTKVAVDGNTFKTGEHSLCLEFSTKRIEALVQEIQANAYLPNREYVLSFWTRAEHSVLFVMVMDDVKASYLLYMPVQATPKWKFHRVVFMSPDRYRYESSDSDRRKHGLMAMVFGPRDKSGPVTVWLDDVNVHLLQQSEKDAIDLLDGLEDDMTSFYRTAIRKQIYDVETSIDMLGYDIDDFEEYHVVEKSESATLRDHVADLDSRLRAAWDSIKAFHDKFTSERTEIISREKWAEAAGLADSLKGWRESWQQLTSNALAPLKEEVIALSESIEKERPLLAAAVEKREKRIEAGEREALASDYEKALDAVNSHDLSQQEPGALELGRIGNREAIPALMKLLKSDCYPVRRNALCALAWMQATNAVPDIMSLLENTDDPWTRRRATQALGMIGDRRASPMLTKLVDDPDQTVRQNAIISLGWLREKSAVGKLTGIVTQYLKEYAVEAPASQVPQEVEMPESDTQEITEISLTEDQQVEEKPTTATVESFPDGFNSLSRGFIINSPDYTAALAVQSLGLIGDRSVEPLLKSIIKERINEGEILIVCSAAIFALGQLGDRDVVPLLEERSEDVHVWRGHIRREALNALSVLDSPDSERDVGIRQPEFMTQKRHFYWLKNYYHRAIGRWFSEVNRPGDFVKAMRYAGAIGVNQYFDWKTPAPLSEAERYFNAAHDNGIRCLVGPWADFGKSHINRTVHYYGKYPAFAGWWREEGPEVYLDDMQTYMGDLDPEFLSKVNSLCVVDPVLKWTERESFAKYAGAIEQNFVDGLQERREYLHMLRKGVALGHYTSVNPSTFIGWINLSLLGKMAHNLDINGTEPSYSTATYENGMFAELCRDGSDVCNGLEVYVWRLPLQYTRRWEIGMCIGLMHARQFYVWYWGDVFKQMNAVERGRPEAWNITRRVFEKMEKLEPYLVRDCRPGDVALVHSGRTSGLLYRHDGSSGGVGAQLFPRNNIGIYQALTYKHTQCDVIWADTMTPEKIAGYKVLFLPDAKTLSPTEENVLREWVRNGGSLIVTGTTTLFDQYGIERSNYGLADVFGVDFKENTCTIPLENIDSGIGVAPKNIGTFDFAGQEVEYDLSYGYDRVKPTTAKILASWNDNKDAAVTVNSFGKGHCVFLTATYPGVMYEPGRIVYRWPLFKHYYEGIPQMLSGLVGKGLELADSKPCFTVDECPWYVETILRCQPEKKRMLFQLLNYDEQKLPITGAKVHVCVPGKPARVYYGTDNTDMPFTYENGCVNFSVRDFEIHEAVVIEY